jgi:hypothetical protein
MDTTTTVLGKISTFKERAAHWRKAHFHCARHYQRCDVAMGLLSVVCSTIVLAFAFYAINRSDPSLWAQISLAGTAIFLGIISATQLYYRPATLSDSHRDSAVGFGEMHRKWELLETMCIKNPNLVTEQHIQQALDMDNILAGKSRPVPGHVLRRYGLPA